MPRCVSLLSFRCFLALAICLNFALAEAADFPMCRNGTFPANDRDGFREGIVSGASGTRVHFFDDDAAKGCPANNMDACQKPSYVIPGDRLMIAYVQNDWICGYYRNGSSGDSYAGWMPAETVKLLPTKDMPDIAQWIGKWKAWDDSITIKPASNSDPQNGMLRVYGDGHWHAQGYMDQFGNFSGTARPEGNKLAIKDHGCEVILTLINNRLLAKDNHACGALNVTFSEVYDKN